MMIMKLVSNLVVDAGGSDNAEKLYRALQPETRSNKSKAAKVALRAEGHMIILTIESSTIAAMRALLNSYIRWVCISLDIIALKGE